MSSDEMRSIRLDITNLQRTFGTDCRISWRILKSKISKTGLIQKSDQQPQAWERRINHQTTCKLKELINNLLNNVFPRTQEWVSIEAYFMSRDLEVSTLDDFFITMELHEFRLVLSNKDERYKRKHRGVWLWLVNG